MEKYITRCLDSVLKQTYADFEIILIDDESTDQSGAICDQYAALDSRIRVYHKKNQGVSAARNEGIRRAKGEWLLFIDSDDWIDERLLEICFDHITAETDICFFGLKEVTSAVEKTILDKDHVRIKQIEKEDFLALQYRIFNRDREACCDKKMIKLSSPCKLYRKDMLLKHNITFPENLVNGEDGVFNLYAYQYAESGVCIEEELYFYYVREDSVTHKYTPNVELDFRKLHSSYEQFLNVINNKDSYYDVMKERLIWSFSFCCILKYCHPDNPDTFSERRKQFLAEYDHYKDAIQDVSLKSFGLKKKIVFSFIKKRNFLMVFLLCRLQDRIEKRKR
jgi:glycosyltransferase involved in cell wall biosynthesis